MSSFSMASKGHNQLLDYLKIKLLNSPEWVISSCVFLIYWIVNKSYTGPTVLNDEIGYLVNAALISGHIIDGANSYHAGYSFFLAPLFLIFSEPSQIWQAVMVLNAFIWALSFFMLARILKALVPEYKKEKLLVALLISAIYPAWITMSGYVFATTTFVFVFLLAILALLFWQPEKSWTIVPHSFLAGYLYWIHPIGLAVCIASVVVVGAASLRERRYLPATLNTLSIAVLIIIYGEVIDKWLVYIATPEGYNPLHQHYPEAKVVLGRLLQYDFWLESALKAAGQISYLVISSFGIIYFGFTASVTRSSGLIKRSTSDDNNYSKLITQSTFAFLALSLFAVLAMGVLFLSVGGSTRIDQWIYGRYVEMVVLPLLALGFLSYWHKKWLIVAVLFSLFAGTLLDFFVNMEVIHLEITTVAFWPQYLVSENNYLYWMALGSIAVAIIGMLKNHSNSARKIIIGFILVIFMFSSVVQAFIHHERLEVAGTPSPFVGIIQENYPPGKCVGFNLGGIESFSTDLQKATYYLHLFHLYNYTYRRMSPEEWLNSCNGPYITFNLDGLDEQKGVLLVGKDVYHSIYLLAQDDGRNIVVPDESKTVRFIDHR